MPVKTLAPEIRAGMIFFARGDERVLNALTLRFLHEQSLRRVAAQVGTDKSTVDRWCKAFAESAEQWCRLEGKSPKEMLVRG